MSNTIKALLPDGRLPQPAVAHVQELIGDDTATNTALTLQAETLRGEIQAAKRDAITQAVTQAQENTPSGVEIVSDTVTLTADGPAVQEYMLTGPTRFTGAGITAEDFDADTVLAVMHTASGQWRVAVVGEGRGWREFGAARPDETPPVAGTTTITRTTADTITLTATGASDETALAEDAYSASHDGVTWTPWQAQPVITITGLTGSTSYQVRHRVRDAAGHVSESVPVEASTLAPPEPLKATLRYLDWQDDRKATRTFEDVPLGEADAQRSVVVAYLSRGTSGDLESIKVGGVQLERPTNLDGWGTSYGNTRASKYVLMHGLVPTGTQASVEITMTGEDFRGGIAVWTVNGPLQLVSGAAGANTAGETSIGAVAHTGEVVTTAVLTSPSSTYSPEPGKSKAGSSGALAAWTSNDESQTVTVTQTNNTGQHITGTWGRA
ncbi:hypothetical protein ACUIAC_01100 [Dermabacteraceae bacterium P13138]